MASAPTIIARYTRQWHNAVPSTEYMTRMKDMFELRCKRWRAVQRELGHNDVSTFEAPPIPEGTRASARRRFPQPLPFRVELPSNRPVSTTYKPQQLSTHNALDLTWVSFIRNQSLKQPKPTRISPTRARTKITSAVDVP